MTVFAAASSRELVLIIVASVIAAILVNIPTIAVLIVQWIAS